MFSSIIATVNELAIALSDKLKRNFYNYNDLETAIDEYTLVSKDGSMLTVLKIDGVKNIISGNTYLYSVLAKVSNALSSAMEGKKHIVQSCFQLNPQKSEILIEKILRPSYLTCQRLNIDLEYMLNSQKEVSRGAAAEEKNFLLLWTTLTALTPEELKKSNEQRANEFKNADLPTSSSSSNPFVAHMAIYDRHKSFVDMVNSQLGQAGIVIEKMKVQEAVREIRMGVDEEYTSENWEPFLPGDRILPTQMKQTTKYDEWDVIAPKLSQQICNKDAEIINSKIVKVGNTYYAPIYIDLMPKEVKPFTEFFKSMLNFNMPWRILYTITGNGMAGQTLKNTISRVLSISSESNKLYNDAYRNLKALQMSGGVVVSFQIALCTWADSLEKIQEQAAKLARATEAWGNCNVSEITGNPVSGLASASMGFTSNGIATVTAAPLDDAISMLPFARPSALWEDGACLLNSPDGKLMPYQPMSSVQATWISLIFAGPGSGKSVFMNKTHMALCSSAGIERLPRIAMIEVGPTSKGFIELMRDALPKNKKEQAVYINLINDPRYAINPMDLKVGCRFPLATDRQFIINLMLLTMSFGDSKPNPILVNFITDVVDAAFEYFSDSPTYTKNDPKVYTKYVVHSIDEKLAKLGYNLPDEDDLLDDIEKINDEVVLKQRKQRLTWHQVCDILAKEGDMEDALLATRRASPIITDLPLIARNTRSIQDKYKGMKLSDSGDERTIFDDFEFAIDNVVNAYPLLSGYTKFDLGEARLISLDLNEVAKSNGMQADMQTAIMYMYAMKLTSGDFFLSEDNVKELPFKLNVSAPEYAPVSLYKKYHAQRIAEIREDKKRVSIDEFHRTSKSSMVREQVVTYMREGRKWGVEVILASQNINDYDKDMLDQATATFVMSANKTSIVNDYVEKVGITDEAEIDVLKNRIHPPLGRRGNVFMAKFETKRGNFTQILNNKMGPVEIWSLSTTSEDVRLRSIIFSRVGSVIGRKVLSDAYPDGSAASDIENRKRYANVSSEQDESIYEQVVEEMLNRYGPKYGVTGRKTTAFA